MFFWACCSAYGLWLESLEHSIEIGRCLSGRIASEDRLYFRSYRAAMGYEDRQSLSLWAGLLMLQNNGIPLKHIDQLGDSGSREAKSGQGAGSIL